MVNKINILNYISDTIEYHGFKTVLPDGDIIYMRNGMYYSFYNDKETMVNLEYIKNKILSFDYWEANNGIVYELSQLSYKQLITAIEDVKSTIGSYNHIFNGEVESVPLLKLYEKMKGILRDREIDSILNET